MEARLVSKLLAASDAERRALYGQAYNRIYEMHLTRRGETAGGILEQRVVRSPDVLRHRLAAERHGAIDLRQWTKTDPAWLVASNQRRCANAPVPAAVRRSRGPDGRIGLAGSSGQ